jgi:hypothetical protein
MSAVNQYGAACLTCWVYVPPRQGVRADYRGA